MIEVLEQRQMLDATFISTADTYVRDGTYANNIYGNWAQLQAKQGSTDLQRQIYLKFNIGDVTEIITNAKLKIWGKRSNTVDSTFSLNAKGVSNTTWTEANTNWNNKPALGSTVGTATITNTAYAWNEIDITGYIQDAKAAGQSVVSIAVVGAANTDGYYDASPREGTNAPQLVLAADSIPAAPTWLTASEVGETSVTLTWTDNAMNETGYRVERKVGSGAWATLATLGANAVSHTDSTVSPDTGYSYRVIALHDTVSNSAPSNTISITTPASGSIITVNASDDVYIRGGTHAGTNFNNQSELQVKTEADISYNRKTYIKFDATPFIGVGDGPILLRIYGGPQPGSSELIGINVYITSTNWNENSLTWNNAPTNPTLVEAFSVSDTAQWHEIELGGHIRSELAAGRTSVAFVLTGGSTSVDYATFTGRGTSTGPQLRYIPNQTPPAAPTSLTVLDAQATSVTLSWTDNATNENGFRIERAVRGTWAYSTVGVIAANETTYTDTAIAELSEGTHYDYRVSAFNTGGESSPNPFVTTWTRLATPTGVAVVADSPTSVTMTWTDNSQKETGFQIEYATNPDYTSGSVTTVTVAGANTGSKLITGLAAGTQYYFRVRATNANVSSLFSTSVTATTAEDPGEPETPAAPAAPSNATVALVSPVEALLTWTASTGNPTSYSIFTSFGGGAYELYDTIPATATTYRFMPKDEVSVRFRISASNAGGSSPQVDVLTSDGGTGPIIVGGSVPATPTGLGQSGVGYTDGVTITWQPSPDANGYIIEWSSNGTEWFAIDEATGGSYTDEYPTIGEQHYRISAYRGNLNPIFSEPSPPLSVHPIAPPVAWYDNNAGSNERGTLSPYHTGHGKPLTFSVVPNDVDYDSSLIHIPANGFSKPKQGTLTLDEPSGMFTYTPQAGFVGTDTFTYWVVDATGTLSAPATVAIDVTNAAPVATPRQFIWQQQVVYNGIDVHTGGPAIGYNNTVQRDTFEVLNALMAEDADEDDVTFEVVDDPAHGEITIHPETGTIWYDRGESFQGIDSFTYIANDGITQSQPVRITIIDNSTIVRQTSVPNNATSWGGSLFFPASPIVYGITTAPSHGTIELVPFWDAPMTGAYYYTMTPGYGGMDSFAYRDNGLGRYVPHPGRVYIANPTLGYSPPPAGLTLLFAVPVGEEASFTANQSGFKLRSPTASITLDQGTTHGTVVIEPDGGFTYTPATPEEGQEPYVGWDFFTYAVTENGLTVKQEVQLNVGIGIPPPPVYHFEDDFEPDDEAPAGPLSGTFEGTIDSLYSRLTQVEARRDAVVQKLAQLGSAWQAIYDQASADDDTLLGLTGAAIARFDAIEPLYQSYLKGLKELISDGKAYQSTYRAWIDRSWDAENYEMVLLGINALPYNLGGLRPSRELLEQFETALDDFGDAAGFQATLSATVFTVADSTHTVLEKAEYAGGLFTGGTYTAATLTTKAGLTALVRTVARNYIEEQIAEPALTPLLSQTLAMAERAGVTPTMVRAGVLAVQGTAAAKAAKGKLKPFTPTPANRSVPLLTKHPNKARAELREAMGELRGTGLNANEEAHHLIARAILVNDRELGNFMVKAGRGGFNLNGPQNGAILPKGHGIGQNTQAHANYTLATARLLKQEIQLAQKIGSITDAKAKEIAESVANKMKLRLGEFWE